MGLGSCPGGIASFKRCSVLKYVISRDPSYGHAKTHSPGVRLLRETRLPFLTGQCARQFRQPLPVFLWPVPGHSLRLVRRNAHIQYR